MVNKIVIFVLTIALKINAQVNLVPNPSFEQYINCPSNVGEINQVTNWSSFGESPDYFNACSSTINADVPDNWLGHQFAASCNAYCGLSIYGLNFREYLGAQLISQLNSGIKYFVSFKTNRCDNYANFSYSCNKQGVQFTNTLYSQISPMPTNNFAHLSFSSVITDSINWVQFFGVFTPTTTYQYIAIGNFYDDFNTVSAGSGMGGGYYLFDDICVSTDSLFALNYNSVGLKKYNNSNSAKVFIALGSDVLTVESSLETYDLKIWDVQGEVIYSEEGISVENKNISLSSFRTNIFFIQVRNQKNILTYKLLNY